MKLGLVVRRDVSHVDLLKEEKRPLGIVVRDGTKDEAGPVVKKVKPKSIAEMIHAVAVGDIILAINKRDVTEYGAREVRNMIKESGPTVSLELQYEVYESCISRSGVYLKKQLTTKLLKQGTSFGFVLRKKECRYPYTVEYPLISNIKTGGPAYKDGLMQEGDILLKVDNVSLSWLSLFEIASIMETKTEAEFTFEYNIRVIDFPQSTGRRIDLDIELPHLDLGIGVCYYASEPHEMKIGKIKLGSVGERCGIFSEGDIILSINDIRVENLNVYKANSLLKLPINCRKISFISTRRREPKPVVLLQKCFCHFNEDYTNSDVSVGVQATDVPHLNTPASTIVSHSARCKMEPKYVCYKEQLKAVKKFQDMLKHTKHLKQNLSKLTEEAFKNQENGHKCQMKCSFCNKTQHSVKLCSSCLSKMNVKCAQSMDVLRTIVSHFIRVTLTKDNLIPIGDKNRKVTVKNSTEKTISKNLILSLTETLPKVFADKSELKELFQALAERIIKADASCSTCKGEIDFASLTTQKLLLLISLNDVRAETRVLINQLVFCLLDTKLDCDAETDTPDNSSLDENSVTESETASHPLQLPTLSTSAAIHSHQVSPEASTSATTHCHQVSPEASTLATTLSHQVTPKASTPCQGEQRLQQVVEEEFTDIDLNESPIDNNAPDISVESDLKIQNLKVDINHQLAYYKLTDISSVSGSEVSYKNKLSETVKVETTSSRGLTPQENKDNGLNSNFSEKTPAFQKSAETTKNKLRKSYKDKGLLAASASIWKSLDTFLHPKKTPKVQSNSRSNLLASSSKESQETIQECGFVNLAQDLPSESSLNRSTVKKASEPVSNRESIRTSAESQTRSNVTHVTTHTETMEVKISNDGAGFGFVLGFSSPIFRDSLPVPIITAIKPKSPAHRIGILAKKDRVLAINGQSIIGIPIKVLEHLKRKVFSSNYIALTIEFDVMDTELEFGTFDVMLNKTLKVGLVFEDMQKGCPMVVKGVVKGSAAHRSGQLFPRDRISFLKCVRNEQFDAISCNYTREESVKMTVYRDRIDSIRESSIKSVSSDIHLPSSSANYNPQSGVNYILKNTSIRSIEGSNALVLEQEVTLFRDPISWDFGFLVGENTVSGKAYVTDVKPGGPASCSGVMKKYDRIVEVNGILVGRSEEHSVLSLLTKANDKVDLLIRRLYHQELNLESPIPRNRKIPPFL